MKIRALSLCILVVATTAAAQNHAAHPRTKAEAEVLACLDALTEAGIKRDVAAFDRLYADDYFHTNADGSMMTKPQVLASYKAPPSAIIDSDRHDDDRVWVRGNVGYVNTRVTIRGRMNGQPYERQWRVSYLFERTKGGWRAVNSHASLILPSSK
ncbi:MAG TPA: nuclear transport factor 2 family protein [Blastocatellia bacterium]|nr:nuclear transport factor 2 family protein [Blastocatellia bacterium]